MEHDKILKCLSLKRVLTFKELETYTGMKKSYLYSLLRKGIIPYSKPGGRLLYFDRLLIDRWLLSSKHNAK